MLCSSPRISQGHRDVAVGVPTVGIRKDGHTCIHRFTDTFTCRHIHTHTQTCRHVDATLTYASLSLSHTYTHTHTHTHTHTCTSPTSGTDSPRQRGHLEG